MHGHRGGCCPGNRWRVTRRHAEVDDERELEAALLCGDAEALLDVARAHGRRDAVAAVFEDQASSDVRRANLVPFKTLRCCRRRRPFAKSRRTDARAMTLSILRSARLRGGALERRRPREAAPRVSMHAGRRASLKTTKNDLKMKKLEAPGRLPSQETKRLLKIRPLVVIKPKGAPGPAYTICRTNQEWVNRGGAQDLTAFPPAATLIVFVCKIGDMKCTCLP